MCYSFSRFAKETCVYLVCVQCTQTQKKNNDVLKARWETNLGINLKNNVVICKKHFNSGGIERQVIKKDHGGNIIFSMSIKFTKCLSRFHVF